MRLRHWKRNALLVLSLATLVAILAPTAEAGTALRFDVEEAFEVDGQRYDPATVTLRHVGSFNPTADFHEVWIDGECLGMMIARHVGSEGTAENNSMVFARGDEGQLVLIGMTLRGEPAMVFEQIGTPLAPRQMPQHDQGPLVASTSD